MNRSGLTAGSVFDLRILKRHSTNRNQSSDSRRKFLSHQNIGNAFFVCSSYCLALKLSAVSFSSAHVTPPQRIIAPKSGVREAETKPDFDPQWRLEIMD
jgi:hypothetical protein